MLTADLSFSLTRKSPGGVFFSLVKKCSSPEQRREIFQKDKKIQAQKKREIQKRKQQEREEMMRKKQEELEEQRKLAQLRQEKNIEKRLYGRTGQSTKSNLGCSEESIGESSREAGLQCSVRIGADGGEGDSGGGEGEGNVGLECEAMEVDGSGQQACVKSGDSTQLAAAAAAISHSEAVADPVLERELELAEEFEHKNEADINLDIEFV